KSRRIATLLRRLVNNLNYPAKLPEESRIEAGLRKTLFVIGIQRKSKPSTASTSTTISSTQIARVLPRAIFAANRITIVPLIRLSQIETEHWFQSSLPSCRYMQLRHSMHSVTACITAETLRARFHRSEPRMDIHFRWKKSLMPVREGKWVTPGIRRRSEERRVGKECRSQRGMDE